MANKSRTTANLVSNTGISTFTDLNITRVNITGVGTISTGSITNLTGTSSTITTLRSTTLNADTGNIVTGVTTNFTSTNGSITNLTGTAATITTGNFTTGNIVTGVTTNFTSTNGTVTNLTGTSSTITTLRSTTGNFTTGNIVTGVTTNFNATNVVITGVTTVSAGTAALPSISPSGDPNTGVFFPSADHLNFSTGGTSRVQIESDGDINIDGGGVFYDATNNRLAIGTTSPSAHVHVLGATTGIVKIDGPTRGGCTSFGLNGTQTSIVGNTGTILGDSTAGLGLFAETGYEIRLYTNGSATPRVIVDTSGRLLVGTSSDTTARLVVKGSAGSGDDGVNIISGSTTVGSKAAIFFSPSTTGSFSTGSAIKTERLSPDGSDLQFYTCTTLGSSPTERMRITSAGAVLFVKQVRDYTTEGIVLAQGATSGTDTSFVTNAGNVVTFSRGTNDGTILSLRQDGTEEGTISVSGSTISYNGAHLSRWSQLSSGAERIEILRGSVLSNLDEMCEWGEEDNEQLNRMKVSDVEGDKNVAGVFQGWDDDDDTYTNDFYCAMTGDFIIRIAEGVTVERGDLLMSAGDGTAKPQDDDIIRSKTIAKVTSTNITCTYEDGSYCVPCVLMAC